MIGAILGDIIGSPHEFIGSQCNWPNNDWPLLQGTARGQNRATDDSILTIALADSILNNIPYIDNMKKYYRKYPDGGYGLRFGIWAESDYSIPYGSKGNGAMMRISPAGWAYDTPDETFRRTKEFTECTHNDPSAILAGTAIAGAIYALRNGISKEKVLENFHIVSGYKNAAFNKATWPLHNDETCDNTMPPVLMAFENGNSYEECVRLAVESCTDTDTAACIVGSMAEIIYPIPQELIDQLPYYLDEELLKVVKQFHDKYIKKYDLRF